MGRTMIRASCGVEVQRRWLEAIYRRYHHARYIAPDPLQTLGMFDRLADREIAGLVAATLAYGNVKAIYRGITDALGRMGPRPHEYLRETSAGRIGRDFADFRYRVTDGATMAGMLIAAQRLQRKHGSIESSLAGHVRPGHATVLEGLGGWVDAMCEAGGHPLNHLLPNPGRGSACKRIMLYLRWMTRQDCIDPGGWTHIRPGQLIVPLDTHMHAVGLRMGWTRRRQADLTTAVELTDALSSVCPADPLRYDFSLTRPGIRREPWPHKPVGTGGKQG
jgi:uncharacterized protein (TIGR02757 family)